MTKVAVKGPFLTAPQTRDFCFCVRCLGGPINTPQKSSPSAIGTQFLARRLPSEIAFFAPRSAFEFCVSRKNFFGAKVSKFMRARSRRKNGAFAVRQPFLPGNVEFSKSAQGRCACSTLAECAAKSEMVVRILFASLGSVVRRAARRPWASG